MLPPQLLQLLGDHLQLGLGGDQGVLVLLMVAEHPLQLVQLLLGLLQRLGELLVLCLHHGHLLLTPLYLHISLLDFLLQCGDHGKIVEGDVVVVVLDLIKSLLVAFLDVVYLIIFPLLHVADLCPRSEAEVAPEVAVPLLVPVLHLPRLLLELGPELLHLLHLLELDVPDELGVLLVLVVQLLAQLLLVPQVVLLLLPPLLPRHLQADHVLRLQLRDVVLLLVQEVLHLLLVHLHLHHVPLLALLQLPVLHPDLGPGLLQLLPGDLPEGVYPVPLQLVEVPLVPLPLQLGLQPAHVPLQLVPGHLAGRHPVYDHRTLRRPGLLPSLPLLGPPFAPFFGRHAGCVVRHGSP